MSTNWQSTWVNFAQILNNFFFYIQNLNTRSIGNVTIFIVLFPLQFFMPSVSSIWASSANLVKISLPWSKSVKQTVATPRNWSKYRLASCHKKSNFLYPANCGKCIVHYCLEIVIYFWHFIDLQFRACSIFCLSNEEMFSGKV